MTAKMSDITEIVREKLLSLSDASLGSFNARLIPTVDSKRILGIATPKLKALAKELLRKNGGAESFLSKLPHFYFEEDQLHAFLISEIRDIDSAISSLETFLPYIDNWATCDQLIPKVFAKEPTVLLAYAEKWIRSGHVYTVRYGIGVLMRYFLDGRFDVRFLAEVASVRSDEYYINMMIAWYFATALAKQYEAVLPYLCERRLSVWVHNKTVSKALESFRIDDEKKAYLRTLKIK